MNKLASPIVKVSTNIEEIFRVYSEVEYSLIWIAYRDLDLNRISMMLVDEYSTVYPRQNKIFVEDIPLQEQLKDFIFDFKETLYIERIDDEFDDIYDKAKETISKYPFLSKYIEIDQGNEIILYGGILTEVFI